ncbi:unnamed protein product [Prorocentrum cordatum]|uniref:Uncharacterized protein n=1 Tax=Prorocentrum cordatum TaxID=2364126 RepID=A0ABN9XJK4_9DINO|nr:unnamed protein product [Polarella glacialis]
MAAALPELMRRTMTVYDYINESLPDTSPHRETLVHIDDQRNYAMHMPRSNMADWHGYVGCGPNNMMAVRFNCLSGASQDGGPKLTDVPIKTTVLFKNGEEWHGHDYKGRSIRTVPKKKYRWGAQSRVQSHAWDDQAGWLDVENPRDDGRGRALHTLR